MESAGKTAVASRSVRDHAVMSSGTAPRLPVSTNSSSRARSRRRGRAGRPRLLQRKKGRARVGDKGGGVRPRAPPGGEEPPRGTPRGGRRPWLSGPTRGTSDSGGDKAAAYTHATIEAESSGRGSPRRPRGSRRGR